MALDLSKIKQYPLTDNQYIKEVTTKKQIVLHHTAGNASGVNTIINWQNDTRGTIATCVCISGPGASNSTDGEIVQAFSGKFWAHHIGVKPEVFRAYGLPWINLDKFSLGVEVCNWGPLTLKDGKYYNYVNREVPADQVTKLDAPYKGFQYYHKYSDAQIQSVKDLLLYWKDVCGIDLSYDYNTLFTVNKKALSGANGVYTHNSFRADKSDMYPCPRLIEMLKSL